MSNPAGLEAGGGPVYSARPQPEHGWGMGRIRELYSAPQEMFGAAGYRQMSGPPSDELKLLTLINTNSETRTGLGLPLPSSGQCSSCTWLGIRREENEELPTICQVLPVCSLQSFL